MRPSSEFKAKKCFPNINDFAFLFFFSKEAENGIKQRQKLGRRRRVTKERAGMYENGAYSFRGPGFRYFLAISVKERVETKMHEKSSLFLCCILTGLVAEVRMERDRID